MVYIFNFTLLDLYENLSKDVKKGSFALRHAMEMNLTLKWYYEST